MMPKDAIVCHTAPSLLGVGFWACRARMLKIGETIGVCGSVYDIRCAIRADVYIYIVSYYICKKICIKVNFSL